MVIIVNVALLSLSALTISKNSLTFNFKNRMPSLSASIFAYGNNPVYRIENESSILIAQISKQVSNQKISIVFSYTQVIHVL
jgi:hypothetical protein